MKEKNQEKKKIESKIKMKTKNNYSEIKIT